MRPSALPPSVRVKSKMFTASPAVSAMEGRATGSVTPAADVRSPSLSVLELETCAAINPTLCQPLDPATLSILTVITSLIVAPDML